MENIYAPVKEFLGSFLKYFVLFILTTVATINISEAQVVCNAGQSVQTSTAYPAPASVVTTTVDPTWANVAPQPIAKLQRTNGNLDGHPYPAQQPDYGAQFRTKWDNTYLYIFVQVTDNVIHPDQNTGGNGAFYNNDAVEIFINGIDPTVTAPTGGYNNNTVQYGFSHLSQGVTDNNDVTLGNHGTSVTKTGVIYSTIPITNQPFGSGGAGYDMEIAIPWTALGLTTPAMDQNIGFDIEVDDNDFTFNPPNDPGGGYRDSQIAWNSPTDPDPRSGNDYSNTTNFANFPLTAPPTLPVASPKQTICTGSSLALSGNAPVIGKGVWTINGASQSTSIGQIATPTSPTSNFTPTGGAGNYYLVWTITNSPCSPYTGEPTTFITDTVVVAPLPTATIAGAATICSGTGTNITFNGTANATVTYTVNGGANQTIVLNGGGTATLASGNLSTTTTYALVSVKSGSAPGCTQALTGNTVVTIKSLPTATIAGAATICSGTGTNITFTGTNNATVTYTINGGGNQTVTLNGTGTATVGTGNITANASYALVSVATGGTPNCGQNVTGTALVTVSSLPTATISGATTVCSGTGATITFNGTANATVTYNVNGGGNQTVTLNGAGTVTVGTGSLTANATYTLVSVTSSGSPTCTQTLTGNVVVTVAALPSATITGGTTICSGTGTNITINGTSGATVTYNINGGASATVVLAGGTATLATGNLTGNATYNLVSITSSGSPTCTQTLTGSATVVVNSLPTATIGGTATICSGTGTNITFTGTSGATVTYTVNGGANQTIVLTGGTATLATGNLTTTTTYALKSITSGGTPVCGQTLTGNVVVTVNALPTATIAATATTVCSGTGTNVTITGTSGATVTYNINGGGSLTTVLTGGTSVLATGNLTTAATYNLVSIVSGGSPVCSQTIAGSVTVAVNALPTATVAATATTVCSGTGTNVTITGTSGATVTYNINGGTNLTTVLTGGTSVLATGSLTAGATYNLVSIASGGVPNCTQSLTGSITVAVNALPTATIAATATTVCSGTGTNITFTGTSGATVTYTINGGTNQTIVLTGGTATVGTGNLTASATYALVSIASSGAPVCSQSLTGNITVGVTALPTATISGAATICSGTGTNITFTGTSGATVTYNINGGGNLTTVLTGGTSIVATGNITANATYNLVSIANGACGQSLTGSVLVTVNSLPTATIAGATTICSGTTTAITFSGTANATVTYKINAGGPLTIVLNGAGAGSVTTATLTANTTYTLISVTSSGSPTCTQTLTGSAIVTVNSLPTATVAATATTVCSGTGTNITFTGTSGATVTYTLNGGANQTIVLTGGTATVATGNLTANAAYALVSIASGGVPNCTQNLTGSATVTVAALPTATISGTATICSGTGTNITFNGTSGATVTYTVNGGANQTVILTGGTATVGTGNLAANATYALVSITNGTCGQTLSGTAIVTVATLPTATISGATTICSGTGATITFTGTANATVTYTINGGGPQTIVLSAGGTATVGTGNITANATYNLVSVTSSGSPTCTQTLTGNAVVTVNSLPTATIAATATTVCSGTGTNITITGTSGATVTYTINGGANQTTLLSGGTSVLATGNLTAPATYTLVSITSGGSPVCSQNLTGAVTVAVNSLPTVAIGSNATICSGTSSNIIFTGTVGATVTYTINSGANQSGVLDALGKDTVSTGAIASNATYKLVSVASSGSPTCSKAFTNSVTVTVVALPVASISGTATICSGTTTTVAFAGTANAKINYTINGGANQNLTLDVTGADTLTTAALTTTTTYSLVNVQRVPGPGCTQTVTGSAIISIASLPTASISGGTTVCSGTGTSIIFNGTPNATVTYNINGGANQTVVLDAVGTASVLTGSLTATATYTLVSVASSGVPSCSQSATGTAVVAIAALPAVTISGTTTICSGTGATITFNGTANATVTYKLNGGANQTVTLDGTGTATVLTGNLTANATYALVSITSSGSPVCSQPQTGSAVVTVNALPTATVSGTSPVCSGTNSTITFTGTANATVTYQVNGGANQTILLDGTGHASLSSGVLTANTTYSLVSVSGGTPTCGQPVTSSAVITVYALPAASISGTATITIGTGTNIAFNGTANATVTYTINGGANQTIVLDNTGAGMIATGNLAVNTTYALVSVALAGTPICTQTATGSAVVTVTALPTATISGSTTICSGGNATITFNGSPNGTVSYTVNSGPTVTILLDAAGNATLATGTLTTTTTYALQSISIPTPPSTQLITGSAVVTVKALPIASISGATTICSGTGTGVTFSGTNNAIVTYTINGGPDQTVTLNGAGSAVVLTGNLTASATYALVSVDNSGTPACTQPAVGNITVTVNALPAATIAATATTVCSGAATTISFTGSIANSTITYTINGGPNQTIILTGTTGSVSTGVLTSNATYSLVSVSGGTPTCSQNVTGTTAVVTVNALPTATISGTATVCSGTGSSIVFNGTSGATVTYTINGGANQTVVLTGGTATVLTGALTANATYALVSISGGTPLCSQALTGSAIVTVASLPTVTIVGTSTICSGTDTTISFTGTANAVVTYTVNGGPNLTITLNAAGTATLPTGILTSPATYTLVSIASSGSPTCSQSQTGSAVVSVNPLPSTTIGSAAATICSGSSTNITFNGTANATVTYTINNGTNNTLILDGAGAGSVSTGSLTDTTGYELVSIASAGSPSCSDTLSDSVVVLVNPLPTASSVTGASPICFGTASTIIFNGTPNATVTYTVNGGPNHTVVLSGTGSATIGTGNLTSTTTYNLVSVASAGIPTCTQPLTTNTVVVIDALPTATVGGTATISTGTGTNITFGNTPNATVTYTINGGPNQTIVLDAAGSATLATGNLSATTTYALVSVALAGTPSCTQTSTGSAVITVSALPSVTIGIVGAGTICNAASTTISFNGNPNGVVTYTINGGPNQTITLDASGTATLATGSLTTTTTYALVSISVTTPVPVTQPATGTAVVSIAGAPTATINGTATICSGTGTPIGFNGTANATVTYTINGGPNQTIVLDGAGTATVGTGNLTANATYALVSVASAGPPVCTQALTGAADVTVNSLPVASISGSTAICSGTGTVIAFAGTANATVTYSINGGPNQTALLNASGVDTVLTGNLTAATTYALISVTSGGAPTCSQNVTGSAVITIIAQPTATISGTATICSGTGTTISFNGTAGATVTYTVNGGANQTVLLNAGGTATVLTGNLTGTTTYALVNVATSVTCSQNVTGNAIITITPQPTATISGDTTICSGSTAAVIFSGTANATVTYTINSGANQTLVLNATGADTITTAALTTNATYALVSVTSSTVPVCTQNVTGTVLITVNALPTATISGTTSICSGSGTPINFAGTANATITYTINGGPNQTIVLDGTGAGTVGTGPLTASATYALVSATSGGTPTCNQPRTGSAVVSINSLPTATISGTASICSGTGATINFSGTPNATVTYTVNGGPNQTIVLDGAGAGSVGTGNLTGTATYALVSVSSGICGQPQTGTAVITVNTLPVAGISGTATITTGTGTTISFSGTPNATITYQVNSGPNLTIALDGTGAASLPTGNLSATTTYSLVGVMLAGTPACPQPAIGSAVISVSSLPSATISGTNTICSGTGATVTINGNPNGVVTYTINGGTNQTVTLDATGTATLLTGNLTATATYSLVSIAVTTPVPVTQPVTGSAVITVNALPTATISGTATVLPGTDTTVIFSGTANATVTYTVNGGANQTVLLNAAGTDTLSTGALLVNTNYALVSVDLAGTPTCTQTPTGNALITVTPLPTATISGTTTICSGTSANITFSGTPNAVVTYTVNSGANQTITLDAAGTAVVPTGNITTADTYALVSVSVTTPVPTTQPATGSAIVSIASLPIATITGATTICSGTGATIGFNGTPNATVTYTINSGANQTVVLDGTGAGSVGTGSLTANASYQLVNVIGTGTPTCSQPENASALVTVNPPPTAAISGTATIVTGTDTTVTFSGTANSIVTYTVNGGPDQTVTLDGIGVDTLATGNLSVNTTYSLVSVALSGTPACPQTAIGTAVITVSSLPIATISGTTTICSGTSSSIVFNGTPNAVVTYTINGGPNQTITLSAAGTASILTGALTTATTYSLVSVAVTLPIPASQTLTGNAVISIASLPVATITGTDTICFATGTVLNFNGTANGTVMYTVNGGATQSVALNGTGTATLPTGSLTATTTYSLVSVLGTGTPTCSQPLVDSAIVTIDSLPTATISGSDTVCLGTGTMISFNGTPNATITYKINGGANLTTTLGAAGTSSIITGPLTTNTAYSLVSVALAGTPSCPQPAVDTAFVTVDTLPVASVSGATTICSGTTASVAFAGTPNATVTYQINGGPNQTVTLNGAGAATVPTGIISANALYSLVSVTNNGTPNCAQPQTGSTTITVNPIPTATISGTATISINTDTTISFSGTPNAIVTYQVNAGVNQTITLDAVGNATLPTGSLASNTTYSLVSVALSATPSCIQPASGSAVITVIALPTATIAGTITICSGTSTTIVFNGSLNGVVTYKVNGGPDQTITLDGTGAASITTGNLTSNVTYTLVSISVTSPVPATQTLTDSAVVTVNTLPIATISGTTTICAGYGTSISFNGTPNATITYTVNAGPNQFVTLNGAGNVTIPTGNLTATTTYSLVSVQSNGTPNCSQPQTGTAVVSLNPLPVATISGSTTICAGTSTPITFTGTANAVVTYTINAGGNQYDTLDVAGNGMVPTGNLTANTTYALVSVAIAGTPGCTQPVNGSVLIGVNPLPIATISGTSTICYNTTANIALNGTAGATVTYTINGGPNQTAVLNGTGNATLPTGLLTSNTTYTLINVVSAATPSCPQALNNSAVITVNALPTVTISGTSTICFGGSAVISFNGTPGDIVTYTINGGSNLTATLDVSGVARVSTGTLTTNALYSLVSVESGVAPACPQAVSGSAAITVNALPTATISGTATICSGTSTNITFNGTASAIVTYTVDGGSDQTITLSPAGSATLATPNLTANSAYALVSITNTTTPTCSQPLVGNVAITVDTLPVVTISGTTTICAGASTNINFRGTPNATVTYTINGGINLSVILDATGNAQVPTGSITANQTYALVSVANNGTPSCSQPASGTVTITVNALPFATISGDTTICSGSGTIITFAGMPNATVTYTINGGPDTTIVITSAGTATIATGNLTTATTYTLISVASSASPSCPQPLTGSAVVTVNTLPTVSIFGTTTVCAASTGTNIIFSGTPNGIVTYTINGGINQTITLNASGIATVATGNLIATTTYTLVSVANGGGIPLCSQPENDSAVVTVNALPTVTISGTTSICAGTGATILFTGTANATVTYTLNGGVNQTIVLNNSGTNSILTGALTASETFDLISVANQGTPNCTQPATGSAVITVNALPRVGITGTTTVCSNSSSNVTFTGTPNAIVDYTINGVPATILLDAAGSAVVSTGNITVDTKYQLVSVQLSGTPGCPQLVNDSILVSINQIDLIVKSPITACAPSTVDITTLDETAGSTPGLTFTYWADPTVTFNPITPAEAAALAPSPNVPTTYYIKGTSPLGCYTEKPVTITIKPIVTAPEVADQPECQGVPAGPLTVLQPQPGNTIAYWYTEPIGGDSTTEAIPVTDNFGVTTYYVAYQDRTTGCLSTRVPQFVSVIEKPLAKIDLADPTHVDGGNTIVLANEPTGDNALAWTTSTDTTIFSTLPNPTVKPPYGASDIIGVGPDGGTGNATSTSVSTTYILTVTSAANTVCTAKDSVTIVAVQPLVIPNIFSPNGDPQQAFNKWYIGNIDQYPQAQVSIFNRYGQFIYESAPGGYTPWDGNFHGQPLPVGTYFYIIKLTPSSAPMSGPISIVR